MHSLLHEDKVRAEAVRLRGMLTVVFDLRLELRIWLELR